MFSYKRESADEADGIWTFHFDVMTWWSQWKVITIQIESDVAVL